LFGTSRPVLVDALPASAWLDGVLRTAVLHRVLVLVTGTGGERLARAAEGCGKEAVRLHVAAGRALEAEVARQFLDGPPFDAVLIPHVEPGTGVLEPLAELAATWRSDGCLVLADVGYTLGAMPLAVDAWGLDAAWAPSHLALGLSPGLSCAVLSDRLLARVRGAPARGWALDLLRHVAAAERGRPLHAPPPAAMGELLALLDRLGDTGALAARSARHAALRAEVDVWAARRGVSLRASEGRRAPTLSVLRVAPRSAAQVLGAMRERGFALGRPLDDGGDAEVALGHMGDLDPAELAMALDALGQVLEA
jgi:alanine-glyoxylate transaminase/serine-glyoxylate transaminase/serine-pyruvate transaminase